MYMYTYMQKKLPAKRKKTIFVWNKVFNGFHFFIFWVENSTPQVIQPIFTLKYILHCSMGAGKQHSVMWDNYVECSFFFLIQILNYHFIHKSCYNDSLTLHRFMLCLVSAKALDAPGTGANTRVRNRLNTASTTNAYKISKQQNICHWFWIRM